MTYNKPNNITYVDMCIYFDKHIYDEERNDSLLYQYLYHICYMLACKKNYFVSWEDYDKFALYMATKIYLRYVSPKHGEETTKIKSVLNYCKALLYPTKVDYQKETFAEIIGSDPNSEDDFTLLNDNLRENVQSDHINDSMVLEEIFREFKNLPKLIWKEIRKTPYTKDVIFTKRLFMSVLLTLVKGLTLSNSAIAKIQRRLERGLDCDGMILDSLTKEREESLTLWRIESKYANLVNLLAFKVRKSCGESVGIVRKDFELSDEDVTAVLASAYGNVARDNNEEF